MRDYARHLVAGGLKRKPVATQEVPEPVEETTPLHTEPDAKILDSWARLQTKRKMTTEEAELAEQVLGPHGLRVPTLRKKLDERRNVRLSISVTQEEANALNAKARNNGMTFSSWVRSELLGPERGRAKIRSDKGTKKKKQKP